VGRRSWGISLSCTKTRYAIRSRVAGWMTLTIVMSNFRYVMENLKWMESTGTISPRIAIPKASEGHSFASKGNSPIKSGASRYMPIQRVWFICKFIHLQSFIRPYVWQPQELGRAVNLAQLHRKWSVKDCRRDFTQSRVPSTQLQSS